MVIELIDLRDENARQMQPGRFILDRFATPTISRGYREKSKVTVQDYISAKDIIKNRIVWIKGSIRMSQESGSGFAAVFPRDRQPRGFLCWK